MAERMNHPCARTGLGLEGEKCLRYGTKLGEPTKALPGTTAKVEVMKSRAARGLSLFHPLDARHAGGPMAYGAA